MIRFILILIISISPLFSKEFYLNPHFEKQLKKDTNSYNIIKDYVGFLNTISTLDRNTQIKKVNNYINAIIPRYDAYNYKNEEYWATPFEFFMKGGGDCEDYVIAKKYTLELMEIPPESMYYSVVKEKYIGGDHMVLSLHVKKNNSFLVLDNLSTKVLTFDKRIDLEPVFIFNKKGFYKFDEKWKAIKINKINIPSYNEMKTRYMKTLILVK